MTLLAAMATMQATASPTVWAAPGGASSMLWGWYLVFAVVVFVASVLGSYARSDRHGPIA